MVARRWLLVLPCVVASCGGCPSEPLADLEVVADRSTYAVGSPIVISVQNTTQADAFFYHCNNRIGFVLQERSGAEWVNWTGVDGPVCPAIYISGILVLIPGSAYEKTIEIEEAGIYRAVFETGTKSTGIGSQVVYSNAFEVLGEIQAHGWEMPADPRLRVSYTVIVQ